MPWIGLEGAESLLLDGLVTSGRKRTDKGQACLRVEFFDGMYVPLKQARPAREVNMWCLWTAVGEY